MVKKISKPVEEDEIDESPAPAVKKAKKAVTAVEGTPVKKAAKAKAEDDGSTVSLAKICEENSIDSRAARVRLRRSEFNKGDGRWAWPVDSKELADVIAFLTKPAVAKAAKAEKAPKAKVVKAVEADEGDEEGEDEDEAA